MHDSERLQSSETLVGGIGLGSSIGGAWVGGEGIGMAELMIAGEASYTHLSIAMVFLVGAGARSIRIC